MLENTGISEVRSLPKLKTGRKLMLGEELDAKVKNYVQALRSAGTPVGSCSIVMAAGEGIVRAHDRTQPMQHHQNLGSVIAEEVGVYKAQGHHQVNTYIYI